jgi:hypothetical protein
MGARIYPTSMARPTSNARRQTKAELGSKPAVGKAKETAVVYERPPADRLRLRLVPLVPLVL